MFVRRTIPLHNFGMMSLRRSTLRLSLVLVSCTLSMGATLNREQPLFLTPYIERGDIRDAQNAARNPSFFGNKESYSGYITVNKSTDTHLFFWYFRSEMAPRYAPVVLWLQGGPGASSLVGAFLENGPYNFRKNSKLVPREHYWSQRFHVLYIDNPVGSGYSYTERNDYAEEETKIGMTLYEAVTQFFLLFPELKLNHFYVAGESYAGKYVPALAHRIHTNNPNAKNFIHLRGIALGNAIIDPVSQIDNGDLYYQLGILDDKGLRKYKYVVDEAMKYIKAGLWERATEMYVKLFDLTYDASGLGTLYNLVKDKNDIPLSELEGFLDNYSAKTALHVGWKPFHMESSVAYMHLLADRTKSIKSWFTEILENYDVLVYNGQLDLNKPYSGMVHFMNQLEWSGARDYRKTTRTIWKIKGDVAGYSKTLWHRSTLNRKPIKYMEVLIRNAGHLVPRDQPVWAMDMMMEFAGMGSGEND